MERLPLKRHYQITLVNELTRIATFFMGIGVSEFSEIDDACALLLVNLPPKTHAKKSSGTAVNIGQTRKGFHKNRPFPL